MTTDEFAQLAGEIYEAYKVRDEAQRKLDDLRDQWRAAAYNPRNMKALEEYYGQANVRLKRG